jgi:fibro-slime domain-containing protein
VPRLTTAPTFAATVRDFHATHPDFEQGFTGDNSEPGVVETVLGSDGTPSYAPSGSTRTIHGPASFAEWFHDVPGINVAVPYEIPLTESTSQRGNYYFSGWDFFPLDDDPRGFGNEGEIHDYDFTLAAMSTFNYRGGEWFSFTADDDLWVFINRHLAIDLGGLHESQLGEVYLDDHARELEISPGHAYQIHLFFAERQQISTDLTMLTNVAALAPCP